MEKSVKDRAADGEHATEEDGTQLFPTGSVEGDGLTLAKFIKPGRDNRSQVKIRSIRVPGGKGLADPEKIRALLITCQPFKPEVIPHMEDGKVASYETVQHYTPIYVEGIQRGDAGRLEAAFKQLLLDDPKGAAKALDTMQADAVAELGTK